MAADELDPEDAKLLTLARAARARLGVEAGAAVRDATGRTYTAAPVELGPLSLSAVQAAVAAAVSSGARDFEAVALVGGAEPGPVDGELVAALGEVAFLRADPDAWPESSGR